MNEPAPTFREIDNTVKFWGKITNIKSWRYGDFHRVAQKRKNTKVSTMLKYLKEFFLAEQRDSWDFIEEEGSVSAGGKESDSVFPGRPNWAKCSRIF